MPTVDIPTAVVDAVHATATDANGRAEETPEIAGAVVGSVIGFAWLIGAVIWLYKRWRAARSARYAGLKSHRELLNPPPKPEAYIIPPDPAVIQGDHVPGEIIFREERKRREHGGSAHAKSMPVMAEEKEEAPASNGMLHSASAPPAFPDAEEPSSSAIPSYSPPIPRRKSGPPHHP